MTEPSDRGGWAVCTDPAIGFDVSPWQGTGLPLAEAKALGVQWLIAKSWHGTGYVQMADQQIAEARAASLEVVGRYAWFLPDGDLVSQARLWTAIVRDRDELPVTIDFEEPSTTYRGRALVARLEWTIEAVSDKLGCRPLLYTGEWYWAGYCAENGVPVDSDIIADCPLFLAAYPRKRATGTRYAEAVAEVCGGIMPAVPLPYRTRDREPIAWQLDGDRGLYLPTTKAGRTIDVDVNTAAWSRLRERVSYVSVTYPRLDVMSRDEVIETAFPPEKKGQGDNT